MSLGARRAFWKATLAAIGVLACGGAAYAGKPGVPDWVQQAAAEPLPAYPAEAKAVVLLDEQGVTVAPDGSTLVHRRRVIKILRPQGREYAIARVWSDADEKLNYMHAWSIAPDGRQYTVRDDEFTETSADERGMLYVALRLRVARPPGADVGAVIAYEYEQRARPYVTEESWHFQEDIPVRRAAFEVDLPPGWKYYSEWLRHAPVAPAEPVSGHLRWQVEDVAAIDTEDVPYAPAGQALAARMCLHYANVDLPVGDRRWAAIGQWYAGLAGSRAEPTPEIAAKAAELTAGETDFTPRLQKITAYLQRTVRYVGIEIGIGGLQPHAAADVFRDRYGDCKDKATLLKAMLGAAGIDATWVMVDTHRGVVDPSLPSILGNHMISAIELPAGYSDARLQAVVTARSGKRYLIFDPTDSYTPVGLLRPDLQGGYGVLVDGEQSAVIELPKLPPSTNLLERAAKFELGADGGLRGTVTEMRAGSEAWGPRKLYAEGNPKQQHEAMERGLHQDFSSFTLESASAENAASLNQDLLLHYAISVPGYARPTGDLLLLRPRVLGTLAIGLDHKERVYPIALPASETVRDSFDLRLPAGYVVDEVPGPVHLDTGFATYNSEVKVEGDVLHYARELVVKETELKPAQYSELRNLMGRIAADEQGNAVLKKQ